MHRKERIMQVAVILLIIGILIYVITGNPGYVLFTGSVLLLLISASLVLLFSYCIILLLRSERRDAVFTKVDLPSSGSSHKVAYYRIGEEEYPCIFPEEGIFRRFLYHTDQPCRVRLTRKGGRVFDRYSTITTIVGFSAGLIICVITLALHFM
ncbi:MAG: hypothetical protein IKI15_09195 [Lachnospiraceae bacterium]|jgi:hypothetical protein|nr:hypothetical protein [Lachnospiraceae bacterium]